MKIEPTKYFDEFLRYYQMAKTQQEECNLGIVPHQQSSVDDDLMKHIHLYDVVERKYAGFGQILWDLRCGYDLDHPYFKKLHEVRLPICKNFGTQDWHLEEWLYVFMVHRVTGSGINYAKNPSGYHNTILPEFFDCKNIADMVKKIKSYSGKMYTSIGYQFPAFPKPVAGYSKGGDYFLCEYAPRLVTEFAKYLSQKRYFRQSMDWLVEWNRSNNLRAYRFQYAAFLADIADFYPELIDPTGLFFYGTNARECIKWIAKPVSKMKEDELLDEITIMTCEKVNGLPYDVEDSMCDFIRWIENYVRPGADYSHVCRDTVWNSSTITDHPFGRQKWMLPMVGSFNNLSVHPSDDYVMKNFSK